jgi:anaerobic selenocysteine-containing dehydrogenase
MLRTGAYGDGFGANLAGLSLATLIVHTHGLDLGPLKPKLPDLLKTPSAKIELAPQLLLEDAARLSRALKEDAPKGLLLIGRRHLRTNNSWMSNLKTLTAGPSRCTLQVHPQDAKALGLSQGAAAEVISRIGRVTVPVELTEDLMPGVVSLPHGWGQDQAGVGMSNARAAGGVNSNILSDDGEIDPLSGNAVLNGIPVEVRPA